MKASQRIVTRTLLFSENIFTKFSNSPSQPKILSPLLPKIFQPVKDGRPENEKKCQRKGEHVGK
jgi:hypothetical protein